MADEETAESSIDDVILAVAGDIKAIGKERKAPDDIGGFKFRGIEDALNVLHPLLVKRGLNIIPRMVFRDVEQIGKRRLVTVHVEYLFRTRHGQEVIAGPFPGEGADGQDKACSKAMSGAWKMMAFEVFSIPIADASVDAEAYNPREDEPPTVDEQWQRASEAQQEAADKAQERLDNLPAELAEAVLTRMSGRANVEPPARVRVVRDLGTGWLVQFGRAIEKAWEKADEGG